MTKLRDLCADCGMRRLLWPDGRCLDCTSERNRNRDQDDEPDERARFSQLVMFPKGRGR